MTKALCAWLAIFSAACSSPAVRQPASEGVSAPSYLALPAHPLHPEIPASEMFQQMSHSRALPKLWAALKKEIQAITLDPALSRALTQSLDTIAHAKDPSFSAVDHFPVIKIADLGKLRLAIARISELAPANSPALAVPPVSGELAGLLGPCSSARPLPPSFIPGMPELLYGDFPNTALSDCQFSQSQTFAQVLSALASGNSMVTVGGAGVRTPTELIQALIDSGHTVEMRNERTFANFLSFIYRDQNVRWPVWVDTGIELPTGDSLVIPMGHSQHTWIISGPLVNARVSYFLGISGVGFFAQTDTRSPWTGMKAQYILSSSDSSQRPTILRALDAAALYTKRNQWERQKLAQNMPADGYGYLGVCNDSTAVLESLSRGGTVTEFPLVRAKVLDFAAGGVPRRSSLQDSLDPVLASLPHDADGGPLDASAFCRIADMLPFDVYSPAGWFDPELRLHLLALKAMQSCR